MLGDDWLGPRDGCPPDARQLDSTIKVVEGLRRKALREAEAAELSARHPKRVRTKSSSSSEESDDTADSPAQEPPCAKAELEPPSPALPVESAAGVIKKEEEPSAPEAPDSAAGAVAPDPPAEPAVGGVELPVAEKPPPEGNAGLGGRAPAKKRAAGAGRPRRVPEGQCPVCFMAGLGQEVPRGYAHAPFCPSHRRNRKGSA